MKPRKAPASAPPADGAAADHGTAADPLGAELRCGALNHPCSNSSCFVMAVHAPGREQGAERRQSSPELPAAGAGGHLRAATAAGRRLQPGGPHAGRWAAHDPDGAGEASAS
jgi:hypothetical protein